VTICLIPSRNLLDLSSPDDQLAIFEALRHYALAFPTQSSNAGRHTSREGRSSSCF
jgi:hypothetical protein